jgi:light-regulated signal transduction histidine kinase (bacteriophytochrome)
LGQPITVPDGAQALKALLSHDISLVLLDVMMPNMDGLEVCRQIKANPLTAAIPVVLLTALTHRDALIKGWEAGADEYLFKPFHSAELTTRIRSMLSLAEHKERAIREHRRREELEQFAYFASHDLREPLRTLTSFSQLLQQKAGGSLTTEANQYLGFMTEAANRMRQLIEDLVSYSIINSEDPSPAPVNVVEPLRTAMANLDAAIRESGTEFEIGPLPQVLANAGQIAQVFQNLLANSIKFKSARPLKIKITAESVDSHWMISVADNGIGFQQKYAERIFVVFKRLHSTKNYPGTGIGLAICKRVIERMGGKIWVESQPDQGTTFFFTLPAVKA